MEKKNIFILSVVSISTLFVAIIGATFAYFTSTSETASTISNVSATTEDRSIITIDSQENVKLTVPSSEMLMSQSGGVDGIAAESTESESANLSMTVSTSETSGLSCSLTIVYNPTPNNVETGYTFTRSGKCSKDYLMSAMGNSYTINDEYNKKKCDQYLNGKTGGWESTTGNNKEYSIFISVSIDDDTEILIEGNNSTGDLTTGFDKVTDTNYTSEIDITDLNSNIDYNIVGNANKKIVWGIPENKENKKLSLNIKTRFYNLSSLDQNSSSGKIYNGYIKAYTTCLAENLTQK